MIVIFIDDSPDPGGNHAGLHYMASDHKLAANGIIAYRFIALHCRRSNCHLPFTLVLYFTKVAFILLSSTSYECIRACKLDTFHT